MMKTHIFQKRVVYRKTRQGASVRTPEGWKHFGENCKAAKAHFRRMLIEHKQVFIPRSRRKQKSFAEVMNLTTLGVSNAKTQ